MKQLVDRILSLSVWTPGSRLMRRLRFPGKFSLISLGFMVPLLWLLCVYYSAAMQDLRVVRLERTGLRFVQPLYQAREAAIGWRLLARNAAQGEPALHPEAQRKLLEHLTRAQPAQTDEVELAQLTDRERDVLGLIARGLSNRQIADTLHITEGTVKGHVSNILSKLHLQDRTQAALYAVRHGLVKPD